MVAWSGAGDGFLAWALIDGTIFAAPFDLRAKKLTGPGRPIGASALAILGFPPPVSALGTALVYVPTRTRVLARVDRSGQSTTLLGIDRTYHSPRVSPDGRRVAFDFTDQVRDVWLLGLSDSTLTRFGFDSSAHDPTWLPDGSGLLFAARTADQSIGVFRRRFNGRQTAESLLVNRRPQVSAHTITPDGRTAVAVTFLGQQSNLITISLDEPEEGRYPRRQPVQRGLACTLARRPVAGLRLGRIGPQRGLRADLPGIHLEGPGVAGWRK